MSFWWLVSYLGMWLVVLALAFLLLRSAAGVGPAALAAGAVGGDHAQPHGTRRAQGRQKGRRISLSLTSRAVRSRCTTFRAARCCWYSCSPVADRVIASRRSSTAFMGGGKREFWLSKTAAWKKYVNGPSNTGQGFRWRCKNATRSPRSTKSLPHRSRFSSTSVGLSSRAALPAAGNILATS